MSNFILTRQNPKIKEGETDLSLTTQVFSVSNQTSANGDFVLTKEVKQSNDISVNNFQSTASNANDLANIQIKTSYGQGGSIANKIDDIYPDIYLNFKNKGFDSSDLFFNLSSDTVTGSVGSQTGQWSDTNYGLTLSGTSNCLTIVSGSGYDLKFYELSNNEKIETNSFQIEAQPFCYFTVFVFALGNTSASVSQNGGFYDLLNDTNSIHKFIKNGDTSDSLANFSKVFDFTETNMSSKNGEYSKAVFCGSPLNDKSILLNGQNRKQNEFYSTNPNQSDFYNDFNKWLTKTTNAYLHEGRGVDNNAINSNHANYSDFKLFNLSAYPSNINTPTTNTSVSIYNGSTTTNFTNFSLFFVEMFNYLSTPFDVDVDQPYQSLIFETRINGVKTFSCQNAFDRNANLTTNNYNICLQNKTLSSSASSNTRMFLFDYIHGFSYTEQDMRLKSHSLIEYLNYKYRNLFLKQTTDLQITNSNNSLLFSPRISHPFLNIYSQNV